MDNLIHLLLFISEWSHVVGAEEVSTNCIHPMKEYKFGGKNHGRLTSMMGMNTAPMILPCVTDNAGAKWLKFRVNKEDGILDTNDEIELFVASGIMCGKGAVFDEAGLKKAQSICKC